MSSTRYTGHLSLLQLAGMSVPTILYDAIPDCMPDAVVCNKSLHIVGPDGKLVGGASGVL
ncbi:MAG: hypothetical protein AB4352_15380 [Hormoscilla sp.]